MKKINEFLNNNRLFLIVFNVLTVFLSLFCLIKRLTINYLSLRGNDADNIYFYSTAAICFFVLSLVVLSANIKISKKHSISGALIILLVIIAAVSIVCSAYAKNLSTRNSSVGDKAYQKYSSVFPLDEIKINKEYKDDYSFESTQLKDSYLATSIQKRTFSDEDINNYNLDPKDTWLTFVSNYAYSDSYIVKEIKLRRSFVSAIKDEDDSEIVLNKDGFVVYDGEINYEVVYETDNEFFYATINRNAIINDMDSDEFLNMCLKVLEGFRYMGRSA